MNSTISIRMCRCCASEGTFKDVKTKYHWMGEEEVYSEILKDCFDIELYSMNDCENGGICEVCITQLRNASNFKKQVLHTEQQFKKIINNKSDFIKVEVANLDDLNNDVDEFSNRGLSDAEYEVPIKEESVEEPPKKKTPVAKPSTSRVKTAKTESATSKRIDRKVRKAIIKIDGRKKTIKKEIIDIKPELNSLEEERKPKIKLLIKKRKEVDKHLDNIRIIMESSNATPIRCRGGIGYTCCFCTNQYPNPADLKTHTDKHDEEIKSTFMKGHSLIRYIVKLDITDLYCRICKESMESLEYLMTHLKNKHGKPIHNDIKNHVIPFKFDSTELQCVVCRNSFNNFKILLEHMNIHYSNYVCEVCGAGFVNQRILQSHTYRHKKGIFKCDYCNKIFDTRIKMKDHERAVHICQNKRNKCGHCGEKFTDYTKKYSHEVLVHGVEPRVLNCQACDKTFDNQRSLTVHTKTYHLMDKRHNVNM